MRLTRGHFHRRRLDGQRDPARRHDEPVGWRSASSLSSVARAFLSRRTPPQAGATARRWPPHAAAQALGALRNTALTMLRRLGFGNIRAGLGQWAVHQQQLVHIVRYGTIE